MDGKSKKNILKEDEKWMKKALEQANTAYEQGEIPIGAVLVYNNQCLMKSYNQVELLKDVTAHAEIIAISGAGEHLQSKYLKGATLYVTLEPCAMCAAAIGWSQISRLVVAASDPKKGYRITAPKVLHPKCEVNFGLFENDSQQLINQFFIERR